MQKNKKLSARILSMALTVAMIATMMPATVFATEDGSIPLGASSLACHVEHDGDCGYAEAVEGVACSHLNDDGTYSCAPVLDSGDVSGNAATPNDAEKEYVCDHTDGCGYVEAVEGAPCTHECEQCKAQDSGNNLPAVLDTLPETLSELTVGLTSGDGKVTLAPQEAASGYAYYYKTTSSDDTANKPALDSATLTGWTAYSSKTDITGTNGTPIFVQVIKVAADDGSKIKGWGQADESPVSQGITWEIKVAGTDVSAGAYWKTSDGGAITSSGGSADDYNVHWDSATETLYLKNFVSGKRATNWIQPVIGINSYSDSKKNKNIKGDINIVVEGTNTLSPTGGDNNSGSITVRGDIEKGTLTFSGSGTLTATDRWSGIYVNGSLLFKESGTYVFASDGGTDVGISADKITVEDTAKVTSKGKTYGLFTRNIAVGEGAYLMCYGGEAAFLGEKETTAFAAVSPEYSSDGNSWKAGIMELHTFTKAYNSKTEYYTVKNQVGGEVQKWARLGNISLVETTGYTVTFDANGGSVTPASATTGTDGKLTTLPTPTHSGSYRFDGWFTAASGGTQITTSTIFEANTTIYAHWTNVTGYTVTFDANGGSVTPASATTGTDGKLTTLPTPARSGSYRFDGWFTVASGGTQITTSTIFETNTTIYAHWTNTGGGSSSGGGSSTPPTKPTEPVKGESNTTATVDKNGNATTTVTDKNIADAVKAAKDAASKKGVNAGEVTAVINVTAPANSNPNTVTVNLPKTVQQQVINNKIDNVAIVIDKPDISIGMNLATITEMNKQANADIALSATRTDATKLSTEAKNVIGNRPAFDLKATYNSGAKSISSFGTGSVSVAIPYTLQSGEVAGGLYAVYIDGNGKANYITGSGYDANTKMLRFATNHFSVYGIGYKAPINFTDIANHWAKTDIEFAVNRGLMSGTSDTIFAPDGAMTRGMFVTALGRLAGVDVNSDKTGEFTDVKTDAYYAPYVNWAVAKGIVKGTNDTTFAPDQSISRQEMAVIMSNYAKAMGYKIPETREAVTFADNSSTAGWAAAAVKQMQMAGILSGKDGNKFDPTGTATRAEVAAVLHRYVELVIDRSTAQGLDTNDSGSAMMYENGKAALFPADSKKTGTYTVQKGNSF